MSEYRDAAGAARARADSLEARVQELERENAELRRGGGTRAKQAARPESSVTSWEGPTARQALLLFGVGGGVFALLGLVLPVLCLHYAPSAPMASWRGPTALVLVVFVGAWPIAAAVPRFIDPMIPSGGRDANGEREYRVYPRRRWVWLAGVGVCAWCLGMLLLWM